MKDDGTHRVVSLQELTELLGVSRRIIHYWRKGGLPTWKEGSYRFIDIEVFVEWFEARPPNPASKHIKERIRELQERGEL